MTDSPPPPKKPRRVLRFLLGVGVLVLLGMVVSAANGDVTQDSKYKAMQARVSAVESSAVASDVARRESAAAERRNMEATASRAAASVSAAAIDVARREAAVAAAEASQTSASQQAAANSIEEGTWTVGTDISPGTYKTAEPITSMCYWGIYRSGTNQQDIIQNDVLTGGYATVTLKVGQDFDNSGCGRFVKK